MADRAVKFHRAMAPYEASDVAGFPHAKAQDLVDRGIAAFHPPIASEPAGKAEPDLLDAIDRAALLVFGKDHLGMADEPPASVSDDDLRAAIRAAAEPGMLKGEPSAPSADQKSNKGPKKG